MHRLYIFRKHDIVYYKFKNGEERTAADKLLATEAWNRVFAKDLT